MVGKINYNGTANAGATKQVAPNNASRTSFLFKSLGDTFVLNFGEDADADSVLTVMPNQSVFLTNNREPFEIRSQINVYCGSASAFEAQGEEFNV